MSGQNCQVQSPAPALWAGQSSPPSSASVPHLFLQAPPDYGCITTNLLDGSVIRPRLMQLMAGSRWMTMVTRGTGWDPCPKQGTFGQPPVRSYTCWLRMPREKHFAPQQVFHQRLKMGGQKEDDPLHSTPLLDDSSDHRLWLWCPLSCQAEPMVSPCWSSFPSLEACCRHWWHNGTALPERDSWQHRSSCKAQLRPSCSASCGLL